MSSPFLSPPPPHHGGGAPPLHLTVRFPSLPDVHIDLPDPNRVSVVGLKTLIRQQLVRAAARADAEPPSPTAAKSRRKEKEKEHASSSPTLHDAHRRRLRIIYAGKILVDDVVLGSVLRPVPPPPRAGRSSSVSTSTASTPVANQSTNTPLSDTPPGESVPLAARVYVNCNIGDILPDSDVAAEADAAAIDAALHSRGSGVSPAVPASGVPTLRQAGGRGSGPMRMDAFHRREASGGAGGSSGGGGVSSSSASARLQAGNVGGTTTPAPRGFERLLQAGFTSAEVNQLRLQFNTIQSTRFTPDTMPSPDSLRTMEDNWLDNNQGGGPGGSAAATAGAGGLAGDDGSPPADDAGLPAMLDNMVRAMVIGFMFPLGSMCWLMREEGLWTPRWRMFVSMGIVVSLIIGSVKTLVGEW